VSVANHSPLVAGAVDDFAAHHGEDPLSSAAGAGAVQRHRRQAEEPDTMKAIMARQIASRVRWLPIIERMVAAGVEVIVELGPKNVLTGMMRKILPKNHPITCLQADTPAGNLTKVAEVLAG
jgi:[acyl-carrier-protein] S-malonyltransferase